MGKGGEGVYPAKNTGHHPDPVEKGESPHFRIRDTAKIRKLPGDRGLNQLVNWDDDHDEHHSQHDQGQYNMWLGQPVDEAAKAGMPLLGEWLLGMGQTCHVRSPTLGK